MKNKYIIIIISFLVIAEIIASVLYFNHYKEVINENNELKEKSQQQNENYSKNEYGLKELSYDEFKEKISKEDTFIIIISQTICSHCITFKPIMNDILIDNNVVGYYIEEDLLDEETRKELDDQYNISATPTTLFIRKGKEDNSTRIVGDYTKEKTIEIVKKFIEKYL